MIYYENNDDGDDDDGDDGDDGDDDDVDEEQGCLKLGQAALAFAREASPSSPSINLPPLTWVRLNFLWKAQLHCTKVMKQTSQ